MIVFNLICKNCEYQFEGWFESSREFEKQKRKKIVNCPSCNSSLIKKSLMAPNIIKEEIIGMAEYSINLKLITFYLFKSIFNH